MRELGQRSKAELKKFINVHKFIYRFIPLQVMCRATMVSVAVSLGEQEGRPRT